MYVLWCTMCHDDLRILIAWCLVTFRFGWPQPRCFSWTSFWDVHFIWSGHSLHEMLQQISHRQRDNGSWNVFYGRASQILHYNLTINQYEYIFFIWFCKYIYIYHLYIYIQPTGWRYIRIYIYSRYRYRYTCVTCMICYPGGAFFRVFTYGLQAWSWGPQPVALKLLRF